MEGIDDRTGLYVRDRGVYVTVYGTTIVGVVEPDAGDGYEGGSGFLGDEGVVFYDLVSPEGMPGFWPAGVRRPR